MKPVEFKEQNVIYAKDQPEYLPLPARRCDDTDGVPVISCWKLNFFERIRILFVGKIWMMLLSFGRPLTPSRLSTKKWEVLDKAYFKKPQTLIR